ncbi:hypothetical protein [Rugamonas aquatica]|uniref:Uncharacterized protein n=1 Tax=Rugamonas aquatica TaxID=2743357 RepID=A0A6A7N0Q9_9BURK|nr:hypothetical protein [Rugamonas aquatica]MQA38623.1 hypothetical protein [Rugamonas aquatica]
MLTVALAGGVLALFAMFLITPQQLNYLAAQKDGPTPIPVIVTPMESAGAVPPVKVTGQDEYIRQRIGINILLQSGYLTGASVSKQPGEWPEQRYLLQMNQEVTAAAELPSEDTDSKQVAQRKINAAELAIAAVAVEKFNRTGLHRWMEWHYAHAYLQLFGRLPDLSLGPAQIRISTIRRIAAQAGIKNKMYASFRGSDDSLGAALADERQSLQIAALVMFHLSRDGADEQEVLRNYAGARAHTAATVDYAPIVQCMATLVRGDGTC